jgi:NAD(P)-dependent dehydrogenase (short-subunit alcohol dehydrogenase family)
MALFKDKVALVTGGGSGIGRAVSLGFAKAGARVVVADVDIDRADETIRAVNAAGGEAICVTADVSNNAQVKAMVDTTLATYGRLDYACNSAGIAGVQANTVKCTEDNWDQTILANLKGVWLCLKHQIPPMLEQGGGAIVNISSVAGLVGLRGWPAYVASKHGVLGLTKSAALEYAKTGIRINAVCPSMIDTPMAESFTGGDPKVEAFILKQKPMGRMGTPEEVAEAVIWLCSNAASFVTGHGLVLDGGMVAQ